MRISDWSSDVCSSDLLLVRTIAHRFGGSHAQRDVLSQTLIEAALRDNQGRLARALMAERTDLKPTSPYNWLSTARALTRRGDRLADNMARPKQAARLPRQARQSRDAVTGRKLVVQAKRWDGRV